MAELYERAIKEELAYWPGVDVEFSQRSKHRQAVFHYAGATRFIVMPETPSDWRGPMNCIRDARKELRALGVERVEKRPRARKRTNRVVGRQMPNPPGWASRIEAAPVKNNPLEALATISFPEMLLDETMIYRESDTHPEGRNAKERFGSWVARWLKAIRQSLRAYF